MRRLAREEQELLRIFLEAFGSLQEQNKVHERTLVDIVIALDYEISHGLAQGHGVLLVYADLDEMVQERLAYAFDGFMLSNVFDNLFIMFLLWIQGERHQEAVVNVFMQLHLPTSEDVPQEQVFAVGALLRPHGSRGYGREEHFVK